jgi:hypothetical protein
MPNTEQLYLRYLTGDRGLCLAFAKAAPEAKIERSPPRLRESAYRNTRLGGPCTLQKKERGKIRLGIEIQIVRPGKTPLILSIIRTFVSLPGGVLIVCIPPPRVVPSAKRGLISHIVVPILRLIPKPTLLLASGIPVRIIFPGFVGILRWKPAFGPPLFFRMMGKIPTFPILPEGM